MVKRVVAGAAAVCLVYWTCAASLIPLQSPATSSAAAEVMAQLRAISAEHARMLREIAALEQANVDLTKRIDIHRIAIDEAGKSGERIARLEDFVIAHQKADDLEHETAARHWSELAQWLRVAGSCLIALGLNELWKRWRDPKRTRRREMVVDEHLADIHKSVSALADATNGKMTQLVEATAAAARAEGRAEGTAAGERRERDDPHAGAPGS